MFLVQRRSQVLPHWKQRLQLAAQVKSRLAEIGCMLALSKVLPYRCRSKEGFATVGNRERTSNKTVRGRLETDKIWLTQHKDHQVKDFLLILHVGVPIEPILRCGRFLDWL